MKFKQILAFSLFLINLASIFGIVHIELKRSMAKFHHEYLKNLKFTQVNKHYKRFLSSFIEEKDIPLHKQLIAQKRLATYYGEIEVGFGRNGDKNKSQTFKMLFDTGSCEFWIPSDRCTSKRCLTHTRYQQSMTYSPYKHAKIAIQYLSGKITGDMALETIGLGNLVVPNQVIGVANEVDIPLLDEVIWDGILGLAYPNKRLREQRISPLMDTIINQNLLKGINEKNQFSYFLNNFGGAVTFGDFDSRFKNDPNEDFKWAPISEKNYWTITLIDIRKYYPDPKKNDEQMDGMVLCPTGCKSIIDTGTYLVYGPSDQLSNLLADMKIENCNQIDHLPTLGFIFKGQTINGKDQAFELKLSPAEYVLEFEVDGKPDCVVGFGTDPDDGWTIGQVFLKAYYTVFDRDTEAIGFAKATTNPPKITTDTLKNSPSKGLNHIKKATSELGKISSEITKNTEETLRKELQKSYSFSLLNDNFDKK